ncbi:hypothetical protein PIB30_017912 [Stylosanthes scabra]|uniref:Oxidoreductase-like domain-containing protein n=1 Tax=Stylosanthes scabra TaxID=79078 RepID=A0ABU6Q7J8_9FABA|nr:hypothetical protein [Stylosanthes scabra]
MRAATCSDITQKLLPFNRNNNSLSRLHQSSSPFFLRMATEGARASITPASHPMQPKPDAEKKPDPHPAPQNSPKEIPPPPEKPEPGDCCGSGCVRCVWDTYYEELEEYNRLYKQNPNQ